MKKGMRGIGPVRLASDWSARRTFSFFAGANWPIILTVRPCRLKMALVEYKLYCIAYGLHTVYNTGAR